MARKMITMSWDEDFMNFLRGPVFNKTRIKIGQLTELALEKWLKDEGYWEQYQEYLSDKML